MGWTGELIRRNERWKSGTEARIDTGGKCRRMWLQSSDYSECRSVCGELAGKCMRHAVEHATQVNKQVGVIGHRNCVGMMVSGLVATLVVATHHYPLPVIISNDNTAPFQPDYHRNHHHHHRPRIAPALQIERFGEGPVINWARGNFGVPCTLLKS